MAISEKKRIALEHARAVQRATGRWGGRPRGVLNASTIAKIKDKATFEAEARKRSGRVLDNLLVASDLLDTSASKEVLERGFGKVSQDVNLTGEFQVKSLHMHVLPAAGVPIVESQDAAPEVMPTGAPPLIEQ